MSSSASAAALCERDNDDLAVLLVNDQSGALFAWRAVLGDLEASIVTARSGEEALLRLLRRDFCVILMDVKMAGLDGFETARLVRSRPRSRDTPIIFLTSHRATDLDQSQGYALGAADYLFLPVAPEVLKAKVQVFIDAAKLRRAALPRPALRVLQAAPCAAGETLPSLDACAAEQTSSDAGMLPGVRSEHPGEYVALLDGAAIILYASPGYRAVFGGGAARGGSYLALVHPDDRERVRTSIADSVADGLPRQLQYRVRGDAEYYFESDANPVRALPSAAAQLVLTSRDITERKETEDFVRHQLFHDALTGLPNRLLLLDRMRQSTAQRERTAANMAVLFIDLDQFKEVNDTLGHAAGDRLLQDVAERLIACVREGDTVARLGGDEFVVLLSTLPQIEDAALVAEKIVGAIAATACIEGSELHVTPSIGIAVCPGDGDDPDTLLRNADIAMYHAKREGGARYCFFENAMQEAASRKLALGNALQRAIRAHEFVMHYQPKVNAVSGAICGFEALIRWPQAGGASIAPSVFIPIAEETGRIEPIGAWAIEQAAQELKRWRDNDIGDVPIAVNISALQLRRDDVAAHLAAAVDATGIDPAMLEIELTESGLMSDPQQAIATLHRIHALGMTIAIDDFGTGYSSLAYLKRLPIDKLKIDASFVRDLATDPNDEAIVLAIITLAHVLKLSVIAEGVETSAQLDFLTGHGCDEIQGHYFSEALPGDAALALLKQGPFKLASASGGAIP